MAMKPIFILGFDGLSLRYWEDVDVLPTGCKHYGVLKSVEPPISPAAWTSLITGVDPDEHGISRWRREGWNPNLPYSGHSHVPPLWLGRKETFALINVPCVKDLPIEINGLKASFPPKAFNVTAFVGGLLWGGNECYAKPQRLLSELRRKDYRVHCNGWENQHPSWRKTEEGTDWAISCAMHRRKIPTPQADVTVFVYIFPDIISHVSWRNSETMKRVHRTVKAEIQYWLEERFINETHRWCIISDHGFQDIDAPDHLAILKRIHEARLPWMDGGHHVDGVFMSNFLDFNGYGIKDVLIKALEA